MAVWEGGVEPCMDLVDANLIMRLVPSVSMMQAAPTATIVRTIFMTPKASPSMLGITINTAAAITMAPPANFSVSRFSAGVFTLCLIDLRVWLRPQV